MAAPPVQALPHIGGVGGRSQSVLYRDYYSTTDPFGGDFTAALASYTIPTVNANADQPQAVQQSACDARLHRIPTAYLLLGEDDNLLHIYCQLTRFTPRHGLPPSEWDGRMFIHKGELHNNQGTVVEWLGEYSQRLTPIPMLTSWAPLLAPTPIRN